MTTNKETNQQISSTTNSICQQKIQRKKNYPNYWGIVFCPQNIFNLINKIPNNLISHLQIQNNFHTTMLYNRNKPTPEIIEQYNKCIGVEIDVIIIGYVIDTSGCAFMIQKNFIHSELCTNAYPHISVGNAVGIKPVYNNSLIENSISPKEIIHPDPNPITKILFKYPIIVRGVFSAIH